MWKGLTDFQAIFAEPYRTILALKLNPLKLYPSEPTTIGHLQFNCGYEISWGISFLC